MAQEFIYLGGLYLREPQDKPVLRTEDLYSSAAWSCSRRWRRELRATVLERHPEAGALCRSCGGPETT